MPAPRIIFSARQMHYCRDADHYREKWIQHIREKQGYGFDVKLRTNPEPQHAYLNHNRWVIDCADCLDPKHPSGCNIDPDGFALCFECGTEYPHIVFPPERAQIEREILKRPSIRDRSWVPGQTIEDLALERALLEGRA